ncbi:protein of unknown function [Burkholderia multivorans]
MADTGGGFNRSRFAGTAADRVRLRIQPVRRIGRSGIGYAQETAIPLAKLSVLIDLFWGGAQERIGLSSPLLLTRVAQTIQQWKH